MTMTPRLRKLSLTAHVVSSVGWLGAVASFFALAVAALTSQDVMTIRAALIAMNLTTQVVIVPLCLVSFLTGIVSSLGTEWGLFKHYWILAKLLLTIPSTLILLIHTQPIRALADTAEKTTSLGADLNRMQVQMMVTSGAAVVALLVMTVLSIYKPRGMTVYGWRRQYKQSTALPGKLPR